MTVVGPPGIDKSLVAREVAALAAGRGVKEYRAFCVRTRNRQSR
ncbi:hypothetical protein PJK45_19250 [Mycobacterium kansasii]|uniref:Uncharacterized protein n=2 Tax=Mycobacterium kansasii TaxID=1768 RepID=A0A1V3WZH3_MYCKA|nr:hypothetical protein [Mycobacterium kansasii]EUA00674.1 hypothetical protein I547_4489 [Mycobacterium kansasii 824]EUA18944.1 hypothetical protein I545_2570 [Mycobacterium kansasii 662]KEP40544.1 hypothetical protein MKSMC1_43710 [Mycobacterium kansasii]OOK64043.1 hypothetical protein BZL29_8343 [Mycobacterium kansasii]OOK72148.1 hypothetical protein BZL30_5368 [Mycobacterium kansasii]